MNFILEPWPWYVAGPIIGLTIPLLLLLGNKTFGVSNSFRHICAATFPGKISFFQYEWKKEMWIIFFVGGISLGGYLAGQIFANPNELVLSENTVEDLKLLGINQFNGLVPAQLFSFTNLPAFFIFIVLGGFLVGFGTRYAGGCTSGHAIMGLSNLQWPSLVATCCFMIGGFFCTHIIFPFIFKLI